MLYSYNLLKSSYIKNKIIVDKINFINIHLNEKENRMYDGTVDTSKGLVKLEMKQRQDYFIQSIFEGDPIYRDFQLIATAYQDKFKFENMTYLIYDLSMRYVCLLETTNIDYNRVIESKNVRERFVPVKKYVCQGIGTIYDLETGEIRKYYLDNLKKRVA